MNASQATVQDEQSVGSEDRVETNGWTETDRQAVEAIALPAALMRSVNINSAAVADLGLQTAER